MFFCAISRADPSRSRQGCAEVCGDMVQLIDIYMIIVLTLAPIAITSSLPSGACVSNSCGSSA